VAGKELLSPITKIAVGIGVPDSWPKAQIDIK
jgi:hypothetical protein